MTEIQPFAFPNTGQQVRTVTIDGEPWFVAADVTCALGYTNGRMAIGNLPDRMKSSVTIADGTPGNPNRAIVSEPGVYRLVMRSTLPAAEAFQDWIAEDVVPSIRQTGSYSIGPRFEIPTTFAEALELGARQAREIEAAQAENAKLKVKADDYDLWINGKGVYQIDNVAKMLHIGPRALWDFLYEEKILIRAPGAKRHRAPYSRKDTVGWFDMKAVAPERANGHATSTTYFTPFGMERLRLLLIKRGLLPHEQLALIDGGVA